MKIQLHQAYIKDNTYIQQLTTCKQRYIAYKLTNTRVYRRFLFAIYLLINNLAISQHLNLGTPPTLNYSKSDYGAGHQNWAVLWNNKRVYFANNAGLLSYDDTHWQVHLTPNNTILRSLASCGQDTIFIGGQGELGYFSPSETGLLAYHSLLPYLDKPVDEVWDLVYKEDKLYALTSFNEVTEYNFKGQIKLYGQGSYISKLSKVGQEIWFHDQDRGIYKIEDNRAVLIPTTEITKGYTVAAMLEYQDQAYVLTRQQGIFTFSNNILSPFTSNADDYLYNNEIHSGQFRSNGDLIIGTHTGGIIVLKPSGKADLVIDKQQGLQSNFITSLAFTSEDNLWLGTQNGISKVLINDFTETFYPDKELEGSVYDITKWNNKIFFCTSNGLFYIEDKDYYHPLKERAYKLVSGSKGQVWGLDLIADELFCAHHNGGFLVHKDLTLTNLNGPAGAWKFISLNPTTIAIGTYNGVLILKKELNKWKVSSEVPGLRESSRVMLYDDNNNLWVSHPYKKVYKITFNQDFTSSTLQEYDKEDGLLTNNRNYVFPFQGQCIVTNEQGIFEYNSDSDNFIPSTNLAEIFPAGVHLKRLISDENNYWAISDHGTSRLNIKNGQLKNTVVATAEANNNYIGGFENLLPLSDSSFLQCTESGVKLISTMHIPAFLDPPLITSVHLPNKGDSIIFGGFGEAQVLELDQEDKAILFEFSSSEKNKAGYYFKYYLEGLDESWSAWTSSTTKEYTNLDHGKYCFHVKTVSTYNTESPPASFSFQIKTPWHQTTLAYILGTIVLLISLLAMMLIPRKKYKENTAILESQKRETEEEIIKVKEASEAEMDRLRQEAEIEMERLQREKLENEILFKNKELAMSTMNLLQKNETLTAIRTEIEKATKNIKDPQAKKEVKKIISLLRSDERLEDDWNNFSIHFDQAHHHFLRRIKEKFPNLTPKDQKLCAYLRMNLSTKEIAPLLKISVRGVEISRYRLRKKIELPKETNLNDYMMNF